MTETGVKLILPTKTVTSDSDSMKCKQPSLTRCIPLYKSYYLVDNLYYTRIPLIKLVSIPGGLQAFN